MGEPLPQLPDEAGLHEEQHTIWGSADLHAETDSKYLRLSRPLQLTVRGCISRNPESNIGLPPNPASPPRSNLQICCRQMGGSCGLLHPRISTQGCEVRGLWLREMTPASGSIFQKTNTNTTSILKITQINKNMLFCQSHCFS